MDVHCCPDIRLSCVRFDSSAGDVNYKAVCSNGGGTGTTVDTGIAAVDLGTHGVRLFEISFNDSTGVVTFSIDGNQVATISTTLPATGTFLRAFHIVENLAATGSAKTAQGVWSYMNISSDI